MEQKGKTVPMVGMVVTISPSLSLYRMVVLPAASRPTMRIRISFFPQSLSKILENARPMAATGGSDAYEVMSGERIGVVKESAREKGAS